MLDRIERLMKGLREVTDSRGARSAHAAQPACATGWKQSLARLDPAGRRRGEIERAIAETDQLIGTFNALLLIAEADAGTARGAMAPLDLAARGGGCGGTVRAAGGGKERVR